MIRRFQMTALLIILTIITWSVSACNGTPEPPQVSAISADPGTDIMIGESASLTVKASGQDLQFDWKASRGKLSSDTDPSVIYEAPDSAGSDIVTVEVVGSGGATTIQSITFQVVAPTPTATLTPTPTPTNTPTLTPTDTPTDTPTQEPPTITPVPEPIDTPTPTTPPTSPPTDTPIPIPTCPPANGNGTIPPAIAISSITFVVNGVEQIVNEANSLNASPGDPVQIKEVTVCSTEPFEGDGGTVAVAFTPVENGPIDNEYRETKGAKASPDFKSIPGPDDPWTIGNWQHIVVVTVHTPPGGTEDQSCGAGECERDDRMIVLIE